MRINEAYEHEPILPYQSEESCPLNGCNKVSTQCVDVTASVILSPTAVMGSPTVTCQGNPTITCATNADGTMCTVTMTQKVCVSIPVRYGTTISATPPSPAQRAASAAAAAEESGTGSPPISAGPFSCLRPGEMGLQVC